MAARYWVGGSGTWNTTNTANWSATSGGAGGASVPTSADNAIIDSASGGGTVTIGEDVPCLQLDIRTFTGTLDFNNKIVSVAGNALVVLRTDTGSTVTGNPVVNLTYSGSTGTRTLGTAATTESNSMTVNVTAGTDIVTTSSASAFKSLNFTGFSGTLSNTAKTIFGSLTISSGMTVTAGTSATTFAATSGTQQITTNGKTLDFPITQNNPGATLQLQDNLTMGSTRTFTLTAGTLDLNNLTLSTGIFASTNTNVRTIAYGTGNITVTGNAATVWSVSDTTNLTVTGTPTVNLNYSGATGTRILNNGGTGGSSAIAINLNVSNATDIVNFNGPFYVKNVDFTAGTGFTGTASLWYSIYGNLKLNTGMTVSGSGSAGPTFSATSGTQQITTNGVSIPRPITFNGVGGTFQLQDNLTSTQATTLTNGTLDLNGKTYTVSSFLSSNSNIRAIAFGVGNITVNSTGTIWNTATVTNFSYTGTPTVNISNNSATATTISTGAMTEAQSLNFNYTTGSYTLTDTAAVYKSVNFTGFTGTIPNSVRTIYGSMTLVAGMTLTAGANATTFASTAAGNTITSAGKTQDYPITFNGVGGVWTCQDALTLGSTRALTLTNGTLNLKSGVTSTVGSLVTTGTNQKYLGSSTPGTQAVITDASGVNSVSYLTIQDSFATGGATWDAFYANGNLDGGNNTNWEFGETPVLGTEYTYRIRSFTQPRRF